MHEIALKNLDVLNPHPILREVYEDIVNHVFRIILVTSAYRPGDPGVHGTIPLRGLDFRCWNPEHGQSLADKINARWVYDPARPEKMVSKFHDVGRGQHIHVQVHPNTVRKV